MNNSSSEATATRALDAEPQTIRVGERQFEIACSGQQTPTVVLETGLGAESAEWAAIQCDVARFARVFRYDRAGRGRSDRAPAPRDAHDIVDDLHRLLFAARISGPYVLVGHSFGGLLMQIFAQRYRTEVVGLVLVDLMHEEQFDVLGPAFPPAIGSEGPALSGIRNFWTGGWKSPEATIERIDLVEAIRQGQRIASLDDLAVHVITAGSFLNVHGVPEAQREKLQELWERLQTKLLRLSSRSTQTLVRASGHFIQRDAPRTVIDAIREVHQRARAAIYDGQRPAKERRVVT